RRPSLLRPSGYPDRGKSTREVQTHASCPQQCRLEKCSRSTPARRSLRSASGRCCRNQMKSRRRLRSPSKVVNMAMIYENHDEAGRAVKKVILGLSREELFITSKLRNSSHQPHFEAPAAARSRVPCVRDAYNHLFYQRATIHWPVTILPGGGQRVPRTRWHREGHDQTTRDGKGHSPSRTRLISRLDQGS
ncbi:hypothetical protein HD554DRAFT_688774, partial [Boletus coccyginus]